MNPRCSQFDGDWELFVLGSLDEQQTAEMQMHLDTDCPVCTPRFHEATLVLSSVGAALIEENPPASVERALRKRMAATAPGPARPQPAAEEVRSARSGSLPWVLAAAASVAALVVGVQAWNLSNDLARANGRLVAIESRPASTRDVKETPVAAPAVLPAKAEQGPDLKSLQAAWSRERAALESEVESSTIALEAARQEGAQLRQSLEEARMALQRAEARPAPAPIQAAQGISPAELQKAQQAAREAQVQVAALQARISRMEDQLERETRLAAGYRSAVQVLQDSGLRQTDLRAVDSKAGQATAQAIHSSHGKLLLVARNLPPLPSNKCYQLWIIRRDNPAVVSGGLLTTNASGQALLATSFEGQASNITGFAITDEPKGGSVVAQGRKLLFGSPR